MDAKTKLELMKKHDFRGFGNKIAAIQGYLALFSFDQHEQVDGEKYLAGIRRCLDFMLESYKTISFDELGLKEGDEDYNDFATLFRVNGILPKLSEAVERYSQLARQNNYRVSDNEIAYKNLQDTLQEIIKADNHQGILYRGRIKRLEQQLK